MPQLLKHLPKADCLIEPFVGSGTVFMNTEYRRYVLCDSNRALINFFRVLTSDTERLIDTARGMFLDGNNEEQYYKRRRYLTPCSGAIQAKLIPLCFMPLCFCT
jgi:DNA adenine methylase